MPRSRTSLLALSFATALGLLACPNASAIPNENLFRLQESHWIPLPSNDPGAGSPYSRCFGGEFTGDFQPDLVYLRGSVPGVLVGASVFQARITIAPQANDLDLLPGAGPKGIDGIVLAHDAGIDLAIYDEERASFLSTRLSPSFPGAKRVIVADLDGSGTEDLVVVKADEKTIALHFDLANPNGLVLDPAIVSPSRILDLVTLDWSDEFNPTGALEIAMVAETGLTVQTWTGTVLFHQPVFVNRVAVTRFRQQNFPFDRLAAITDLAGGPENDLLIILDKDGYESGQGFGPLRFVEIVAGDINQDGNDDIAIRRETSEKISLFYNRSSIEDPSAPAFADTESFVEEKTGLGDDPAPGTRSQPILYDVDLDGDLDLSLFVRSQESAILFRNRSIPSHTLAPQVSDESEYELIEGDSLPTLTLDLLEPTSRRANQNALEIVVFRQPHPDAPVESTATTRELFAVSGSWPGRFPVTLHDPLVHSSAVFYLVLRFVEREDGTGEIVDKAPLNLVSFATLSRITMHRRHGRMFPAQSERVGTKIPDSTDGAGFTPPPMIPASDDHGPPIVE